MVAFMWRPATTAVLIAVLAAGCASGTKSGGAVPHPITIKMQGPGGPPDRNSSYFISQVSKRSGGRIRIVLGNKYTTLHASNEPRLVRALRSGKVQMAYIASRAWEEGSHVTAFRALQAPLLVTNYPLLQRITTGPIGRSMLASLNSIGIVGLGLVPERLRRLFGRKPLDSPVTLRGARIRPASPTDDPALRALGAVPVTIDNARLAGSELASRQIAGVESETISIENNNYVRDAHDLTSNVALFAKAETIAIRKSFFDQLSAADRRILRAAAKATVLRANPARAERRDMPTLCRQRIKLVTATPAELASLDRLAPPAYTKLERDSTTTRRDIQAIERLKRTTPTGTPNLPPCARTRVTGASTGTDSNSGRLTGTYTVSVSQSEIAKASGGQPDENWGSFLFSLRNGRFRMTDSRPAGDLVQGFSHGLSAGTYAIHRDRISFTTTKADGDTPMGKFGDRPIVCSWSLDRGGSQLTFGKLPSCGPPQLYVKPWQETSVSKPVATGPPTKIAGTYIVDISHSEAKANGDTNYGPTRLFFGAKRFRISDQRPPGQPLVQGSSGGWNTGTYSVRGHLVTFVVHNGAGDTPLGSPGDPPNVMRWSLDRGTLTLQKSKKSDGGGSLWLEPLRRVR
jgi:TRAP-type C4-dicarboxylate transport system substrate-binding protein